MTYGVMAALSLQCVSGAELWACYARARGQLNWDGDVCSRCVACMRLLNRTDTMLKSAYSLQHAMKHVSGAVPVCCGNAHMARMATQRLRHPESLSCLRKGHPRPPSSTPVRP